jgi:hypothetical protein
VRRTFRSSEPALDGQLILFDGSVGVVPTFNVDEHGDLHFFQAGMHEVTVRVVTNSTARQGRVVSGVW